MIAESSTRLLERAVGALGERFKPSALQAGDRGFKSHTRYCDEP